MKPLTASGLALDFASRCRAEARRYLKTSVVGGSMRAGLGFDGVEDARRVNQRCAGVHADRYSQRFGDFSPSRAGLESRIGVKHDAAIAACGEFFCSLLDAVHAICIAGGVLQLRSG